MITKMMIILMKITINDNGSKHNDNTTKNIRNKMMINDNKKK